MNKPIKEPKPLLSNSLYNVWKSGSSFIVTLASDKSKVQYTGSKLFAMTWAEENGSND